MPFLRHNTRYSVGLWRLFSTEKPSVCLKDDKMTHSSTDTVLSIYDYNLLSTAFVTCTIHQTHSTKQDNKGMKTGLNNSKKTVCINKQLKTGLSCSLMELVLVTHFTYLGVFQQHIQKHIKTITNTIKVNMQNVKQIRPFISTEAAKSYLHCLIVSHIDTVL